MWGVALSALLAIAGHQVLAHGRPASASQQTGQATQTTVAPPTTTQGRPGGPPNGRFGGGPPCAGLDSTGWEWWNDDRTKRDIGLTTEQANHIGRLYAQRVKEIDPFVQQYQAESAKLDKMFNDRTVDDTALIVQINTVSALRTSIAQSRIVMLYHMARVLNADQFAKLKAIHDRHNQDVCGGRGGGGQRLGQAAFPR